MFLFPDVPGSALAVSLFVPLLLTPGYVAGWAGDLFGFRASGVAFRLAISLSLSAGLTPLAVYLLLLLHSAPILWIAFGLTQCAFLWLIVAQLNQKARGSGRIPFTAVLLAGVWIMVSLFSVSDLEFGHRVYHSAAAYDHEFRVAVIDAVTRTGVPPVSPFNHVSGDTALRYHVFWFALCSVAQTLGNGAITARDAFNASVVWSGFSLMALIPLWLRIFEGLRGAVLRRRSIIGLGLLTVTGLDLIPNLLYFVRNQQPPRDMEWWAKDQVTSWVDATLWVPHHVAAVVAGLAGILLLWQAAAVCETKRARILHCLFAGAVFAGAAGCSIYVGFAVAVAVCAWLLLAVTQGWWRHAGAIAAGGAAGVLFAAPNLLQLMKVSAGGRVVMWGLWESAPLAGIFGLNVGVPLIRVLFVPLTYGVEFGFFLLAGIVAARTLKRERPQDCVAAAMATAILLLCTFVRSATIANNDLGWRGFMVLQFLLLMWATGLFDLPKTRVMPFAYGLMAVGLAGTVYQVTQLRVYHAADDRSGDAGRLAWSLRRIYRELDRKLPATAIVQGNPGLDADYEMGLYSHRQTVATGPECLTVMGGDAAACRRALPALLEVFDGQMAPDDVIAVAQHFGIAALVVRNTDLVWGNEHSWIYSLRPEISTPDARGYLFVP